MADYKYTPADFKKMCIRDRGNMFNAEPDLTAYMHRTDNSLPLQSVPLYSIEGTAGLVPLFTDQAQSKPVNFIHIPNPVSYTPLR